MRQDRAVDTRDFLDHLRQRVPCAEGLPLLREKDDHAGRDELLKRPATPEPTAPAEPGGPHSHVPVGGDIREEGIADLGVAVPVEHRVDGLGQLGAAGFIDTAGVDPDVAVTVAAGDFARLPDFVREARGRSPDGRASSRCTRAGFQGEAGGLRRWF